MSLDGFKSSIADFIARIKNTLNLCKDQEKLICHKKNVMNWIQQEQLYLRDQRQEQKKNTSLFTGMNETSNKLQHQEITLQKVKNIMKSSSISFQFNEIEQLQLPKDIVQSLQKLNKSKIPSYYAVITAPLFEHFYVKSKQDFDSCIKKVYQNGLKFISVGSQSGNIIKHQRCLVQQLFNNIFAEGQEHSMVFKLQVQKDNFQKCIEIFCYVEDISKKISVKYEKLDCIKIQQGSYDLYFRSNERKVYIDEMSILSCILNQMLTVPFQTIISNYAIKQKADSNPSIIKMYTALEGKDLSQYIKEHSSLRNPLFFFSNYIKTHQFSIQSIRNLFQFKQLYANFYQILNTLLFYIKNDFTVKTTNGKTNSLLITPLLFQTIWKNFHEIIILTNWIQQIISPIKKTVTLYEINSKLYPIFNEILQLHKSTYSEYSKVISNLPIQNYLTMNVSKVTIQRYKDKFMNSGSMIDSYSYYESNVFEAVFEKAIKNYNISNINVYEAIYFLNFIAINSRSIYYVNNSSIHSSWKSRKIWKQTMYIINKQFPSLKYLSVNLYILAFHFGYNPIKNSNYPFQAIKNDEQNQELYKKIQMLINILSDKFQNNLNEYLSILLQKSFKYSKFKVVQLLIKRGVHIRNYQEIFLPNQQRAFNMQQSLQKKQSIEFMRIKEPQMYRKYQWEQLINVKLKEKKENLVAFETIRRGTLYVDKNIYNHLTSRNMMNNTLSRKDYMFSNNRLLGKIEFGQSQAYLQITQYPLLKYFYTFFLNKVNKSSLMLNYCSFFTKKGNLVHLIESLPNCANLKKALSIRQMNLKRRINGQDISQAIIISMMLMPTNIFLKNIFTSQFKLGQNKDSKNSLFVIDFHDFYQKNAFQSHAGDNILKVRNILFAFQEMKSTVSSKIMKKYSNLNVLQIINSVFKQSASLISQVNRLNPKEGQIPEEQKQLFSIIFQNNFCESLVDRMFKIKRAFEKTLKNKNKITHLQLLEILNPPLAYYYSQIMSTSSNLIERQRVLMDDTFRNSFIVNQRLTHFLPSSYYTQQARDAFPNHYKKFIFQGPTQNLANLYQNVLKFDVYTKKITDLNEYNHEVIEYFIRNIDLSLYEKGQRQELMGKFQIYSTQYLKKQRNCSPLSVFRFSNLQFLRQKDINFSDQRLKELIIQQMSCSQSQFNNLLRRYQGMKCLLIKNISSVQKVGNSLIADSDTYDFKNLKYLCITGCRDLLNIDIKCQQLEHITFRKNPILSHIYIFSRKLTNMDCSQCPKLRLQNIGIYILKQINILLSQNSCEGQMSKLYDKNYSVFLTRILRYLFNCFSQSNTYKVELIMTLIKLQLMDEKILGFKPNQIYNKNLVNIIATLGSEILNLVLSQIFDIFLRNELVDVLSLDQLLKIDVKLLTVIQNYFVKLIKMKKQQKSSFKRTFNCIIFNQYIKNDQNYNQTLSFIKNLINLIDTDKTLNFHLSLSKNVFIFDYSQLINILNKKTNLEKLQLTLQNSIVSNQFMEYLFTLDGTINRICKIQFIQCKLTVNSEILIAMLPFIKSLIFYSCKISTLDFIQNFTNLTYLQFNSCKFQSQIYQVYQIIGKFKSLLSLSFINIKPNLKHGQLYIDRLIHNLMKLGKLQLFDFSENQMNKEQLQYFAQQIHKVRIYQLNLYKFHEPFLNQYIQHFLYHENIKILSIQFKNKSFKLFQSLMDTLSNNRSIVKINLKTDHSIQSTYFAKIKQNRKIQTIQSNYPIPNWVKNHISNNSINKSVSEILEEESFDSSKQKSEDYCRIGLSLDGGGARGLLLATNLDYISRKVGKPLHKIFDYMGGTSIGGVLALSSAGTLDGYHPINSTQEQMQIFELYGDRIFKKTQFINLTSIFETKYDIKSYQDLINGWFKQCKLSQVFKSTNVVVNAVNRLTNQDVIFRSINAIFDRNQDFYMKDVARATSAAPTFFPSAEIKNVNASQSYSLIDGGVGLNNPSKLVIDDIIKLTQNQAHKKNYFLLSLGTGRQKKYAVPQNAGIKDIAPIIDSLTQSSNYYIQKDLSQNYRGHYLRISPEIRLSRKESELDNTSIETYSAYKEFAIQAAQENYMHTISFGKFKNQSFIQWLQQNTDRKHQI